MHKLSFGLATWCAVAMLAAAQPMRVAVMDFVDQTGQRADAQLGGAVAPGALAAKAVIFLGQQMLGSTNFVLIDRRDFITQLEKEQPTNQGRKTAARPSFIHAAQALRADAVLRGSLLSFGTSKQVVNLGDNRTELNRVALRVSVEALNPVDGAVITMATGAATGQYRQTAQQFTELSEDDALNLLEKAIADAAPKLREALQQAQLAQQSRPRIKLSVKAPGADPALVEVDGMLIGTTPLEGVEIFKGDHVLTVGKAGYRDVSKRILFAKDTAVEVPMMRTELSAEEMKQVLEKARLHIFEGEPGMIIHTINE